MNKRLPFFLLATAAFAAGFFTLWMWPAGATAPAPVVVNAVLEPSSGATDATHLPGAKTNLARRLESKSRAASLTVPEARTLLEGLPHPVPDAELPWFTEVLRRWADGDAAAAVAWLHEWSWGGTAPEGWGLLVLTAYAQTDLAAAIAAMSSLDEYGARDILTAAAERDPAATMAFVAGRRRLAHESEGAFRIWLQRDPAAACTWFIEHGYPRCYEHGFPIQLIIGDVAALAPDRVPAILAALTDSGKEEAQNMLASLEVERDLAGALSKFPSLNGEERSRFLPSLAQHLAARGTVAEVAGLLKSLDGSSCSRFLDRLDDNISLVDPDRLLAIVRLPEIDHSGKVQLLSRATNLKPEHAGEVTAMFVKDGAYATERIAGFWATALGNSPEEALPALIKKAATGEVDDSLLLHITSQLGENNTALAERMIAALPENRRAVARAALAVRDALAGASPDVTAWTSLPDAAHRRVILHELRYRLDDFEPAQHAAFLRQLDSAAQVEAVAVLGVPEENPAEFLPAVAQAARNAPDDDGAFAEIVAEVAGNLPDPVAALRWTETLPPGAVRDAGADRAFFNYAKADTAAAAAWLAAKPNDFPARDEMVRSLIHTLVDTDLAQARRWAATIQDQEVREQAAQLFDGREGE